MVPSGVNASLVTSRPTEDAARSTAVADRRPGDRHRPGEEAFVHRRIGEVGDARAVGRDLELRHVAVARDSRSAGRASRPGRRTGRSRARPFQRDLVGDEDDAGAVRECWTEAMPPPSRTRRRARPRTPRARRAARSRADCARSPDGRVAGEVPGDPPVDELTAPGEAEQPGGVAGQEVETGASAGRRRARSRSARSDRGVVKTRKAGPPRRAADRRSSQSGFEAGVEARPSRSPRRARRPEPSTGPAPERCRRRRRGGPGSPAKEELRRRRSRGDVQLDRGGRRAGERRAPDLHQAVGFEVAR